MILQHIEQAVIEYYGVTPEELWERTRKGDKSRRRQIFFYLAYRYTSHSLNALGRYCQRYGIREYDHATVLHAFKKISNELDFYQDTRTDIEVIFHRLINNPKLMYSDKSKKLRYLPTGNDVSEMTKGELERILEDKITEVLEYGQVYLMVTGENYTYPVPFTYAMSNT